MPHKTLDSLQTPDRSRERESTRAARDFVDRDRRGFLFLFKRSRDPVTDCVSFVKRTGASAFEGLILCAKRIWRLTTAGARHAAIRRACGNSIVGVTRLDARETQCALRFVFMRGVDRLARGSGRNATVICGALNQTNASNDQMNDTVCTYTL